ncbi:magnesium transporter MgtC [Caulobacter sp. CCUG 60055]|nr:MgtC/SapB family protein [Caulobacter sp. CCUG 60055]MBQ1540859.1 MgtC/SapB family protein [Caulobacteraceae bacterium]MCI3179272.1 magnesium transporter MgtC [Caulobacter sp. CCUG 60055]
MEQHYIEIILRLGAAWAAGAAIGLERTFHGRPAGFRTHALVSLGCSLVMILALFEFFLYPPGIPHQIVSFAPGRIVQGIMTGIGFLGAGVIFKEGLTVHGLTTAASIWVTAAIGVLIGAGFWFPGLAATAILLITLSLMRKVEDRMPQQIYSHVELRFARETAPGPDEIRSLLRDYGFVAARLAYCTDEQDDAFIYKIMAATEDRGAVEALALRLRTMSEVRAFEVSPTDW